LQDKKKSLLQKMFPKNGECFPELRFPGFTDPWEQRNWEETADISTNMVDPKTGSYDELPHIGPGNIESFTGKILDNVMKVKDSNLISGKFHFYKGDIIYGKINPQLGKYAIAPFEGLASADSYILNTKNGVVQNFLYSVLQTNDFYKYSVSVSTRTGMPKINRDELNVYNYKAPKTEEQTRIGNLFVELDHLIVLHQRKLNHIKEQKKSLLQQMFI
jgi:type I restriction enzyme S subunit